MTSYWGSTTPSTNVPSSRTRDEETNQEKVFFQLARYLTFDQSLTNTGWALFDGFTQEVTHCGLLKADVPDPSLKGFDLTFEKARQLEINVTEVLDKHARNIDAVLIEMPSVTGYRIESSLMAAEKILTVCRLLELPRPYMVNRRHAAKVVTGNADAKKKETSAAVDKLVLKHPKMPWNEHVRDSVLLALSEGLELDPRPFTSYERIAGVEQ